MLDFYVKRRTRFSFRDKRLFEIIEVEITRVDCMCKQAESINVLEVFLFRNKKVIYKYFIRSNFNYCPLALHFCSKPGCLQYTCTALRLIFSEFKSSYMSSSRYTVNPLYNDIRFNSKIRYRSIWSAQKSADSVFFH